MKDEPGREPTEPTDAAIQQRVERWILEAFGEWALMDRTERGDRLLEEVFELLQSGGYDPARIAHLQSHVFGRPAGDPVQEVGGVVVTLAGYCTAHGLDMAVAGEAELARVWTCVDKIRAKQAAKAGIVPVSSADEELPIERRVHQVAEINRELLAEVARLKDEVKKWQRIRKPGHGACCTCQQCGLEYDDCRCSLDETVDANTALTARVAELETELAGLREGNKPPVYEHHPGWVCTKEAQAYFEKEAAPGKEPTSE